MKNKAKQNAYTRRNFIREKLFFENVLCDEHGFPFREEERRMSDYLDAYSKNPSCFVNPKFKEILGTYYISIDLYKTKGQKDNAPLPRAIQEDQIYRKLKEGGMFTLHYWIYLPKTRIRYANKQDSHILIVETNRIREIIRMLRPYSLDEIRELFETNNIPFELETRGEKEFLRLPSVIAPVVKDITKGSLPLLGRFESFGSEKSLIDSVEHSDEEFRKIPIADHEAQNNDESVPNGSGLKNDKQPVPPDERAIVDKRIRKFLDEIDVPLSVPNQTRILLSGKLRPAKINRHVNVTIRDASLANHLKKLYKEQCQICRESLEVGFGRHLVEVHHIQPLGSHAGPDMAENILVLCPNHHAMFDRGAITIDLRSKKVIHFNDSDKLNELTLTLLHFVDVKYVDYHNRYIYKGVLSNGNSANLAVSFGDNVVIQDVQSRDILEVTVERSYNRHLLSELAKALLGKFEEQEVTVKDYTYIILRVDKKGP